jgi:hypothetical protein
MLRKLILISTFCLLAAPAFATEADFEKRMARGVAALETDNAPLALEEFQAAVKEHPNDPEAALYLAIALNRGGDQAAESALKNALRLDPGNPRINLELGTFYYNHKMFEEAGDYFENLLTMKPDPDMATAAKGYIAAIRSQGGGRRWGATVTGGLQYDSNVPLAADSAVLPSGTNRKGDLRGVVNLGLNGVAFRDSQQELTGSYSLYQTVHLNLSNFNLTQNLLDVTYKRRISPLLMAKASGGIESILLGGNQFVNDFNLSPGLFATFQEGMTTGLEYRLRDSFYKDSDLFSTNTDRNGVTHSLLLSHRMPLSDILNLRAGYTFDRAIAKVSAWSSSAHRVNAGLAVTLPNALLLDVSMDVVGDKYDEAQTGETTVRSDTTVSGGVSLTWQASEYFGVSAGYHYTNNSSNISADEYSRGITSVMFQGRY